MIRIQADSFNRICMKYFPLNAALLITIFFAGILCGCQSNIQFHSFQSVKKEWDKKDTVTFYLDTTLTNRTYRMEIEIRHTERYPFRDLWLCIHRPTAASHSTDTIHLQLATPEGKWIGNGKNFLQYTSPSETIYLQPHDSILQITHLMQKNPLEGIRDIGIKLHFPVPGSINTEKDKK